MPTRAPGFGTRAVVGTGTAFELVASTLLVADRDGRRRFADLEPWLGRAKSMQPADMRTLEVAGQHVVTNLLGLASETPGSRSATDFLAHLASLAPADLVGNAAGRYRRAILRDVPGDVIDDAVAGDRAARRQFLDTSWPEVGEWQRSLRFLLAGSPDDVAGALLSAFQSWHDRVFAPEAVRLADAQDRTAAALRAESGSWRFEALLRRVAPTVEYVPPTGVELLEFVPVSSIRPLVVFLDHRMETIVLFAAANDPQVAADAPPEQLVLLGKALGDELRLRALRALATGPRTLGDLAAELGVPRTSLGHHVAILRAAGLITHTIDDGRWGRLALRPEPIADVAPRFREYVRPSAPRASPRS